jgi:putative pyruvate formate lyase activating enzyme
MLKLSRKKFMYTFFSTIISLFGFWNLFRIEKKSPAQKLYFNSHIDTNTNRTGHMDYTPSYVGLHHSGELKKRAGILWDMLRNCKLCPRKSAVNRFVSNEGTCKANDKVKISSFFPHHGEEPELTGVRGSGTIFFSNCSLRCSYCQNWEISIKGEGSYYSQKELAAMMLRLQHEGCHNINFVTPTHYVSHIIKAIDIAASRGLNIPLVYNSSGYERGEILAQLDGIIDIYLSDFKYADSKQAEKYSSGAANYPAYSQEALLEMNRQVGVAKPDKNGLVKKGLMIRHLVLPNNISGSDKILTWISEHLPKKTYINLMAQYHPAHKAYDFQELSRRITRQEYKTVVNKAKELGLVNARYQNI